MNEITALTSLLSGNVFDNITLLKMLDHYRDQLAVKLIRRNERWGVLLALPVSLSAFDYKHYPDAESVILVSGTDAEIIDHLIQDLPRNKPLIFKVQNLYYKRIIEAEFHVTRKRAFHTYSTDRFLPVPSFPIVAADDKLNEGLLPLWLANGYGLEEIQSYFQKGARSYTVYHEGKPASTCLAFPIYNNVWEVGAVRTVEAYRGRGFAKAVVSAAVQDLFIRGRVPRYQTEESNRVSIRLAESVGLKKRVTLEHLYYAGQ